MAQLALISRGAKVCAEVICSHSVGATNMGSPRGLYVTLIMLMMMLCTVGVSGGRRNRWSRRNRNMIVSLNDLGNNLDDEKDELPIRISRERSTLNEVKKVFFYHCVHNPKFLL